MFRVLDVFGGTWHYNGVLRKRWVSLSTMLFAAIFGLWGVLSFHSREPVYRGKSLSFWLDQRYKQRYQNFRPWDKEPEKAFQEIGTNGLATLLKLITARGSPLIEKSLLVLPTKVGNWLALPTIDEYKHDFILQNCLGWFGFEALGEKASPAVPALVVLLNDRERNVRVDSIFALGCIGPSAKDAVPSLISRLHDPEYLIRYASAETLGKIHQAPERVIPALRDFIKRYPNQQELGQQELYAAIESLGAFGPQAKPSVPIVLEFLNHKDARIRSAATNALKQIDPEVASLLGNQSKHRNN